MTEPRLSQANTSEYYNILLNNLICDIRMIVRGFDSLFVENKMVNANDRCRIIDNTVLARSKAWSIIVM